MTTTKTILNVFITNLGKYNEGELIGEWVELPITDDELETVLDRIGINEEYEEYFITDYESDYGLTAGEYQSIEELNDIAEEITYLIECDGDILKAIISNYADTPAEALEILRHGDYRTYDNCYDMTDVAYEVVEESGYLTECPEYIARYFDYESYGRDLEIEGYFFYCGNGVYLEIIR